MRRILILLIFTIFFTGCTTEDEPIESITPTIIITDQEIISGVIENLQFDELITDDLILPTEIDGVSLHFESSQPEVLSALGVIHRGLEDVEVQLTVTYTYQSHHEVRIYPIVVKGRIWTVNDIIEQDALLLNLNIDMIESDVILPRTGTHGSVITWTSSHPHIVSNQGRYYAPEDAENIILTATFHYESETRTKSFNLPVKPLSDEQKVNMAYEMLLLPHTISQDINLTKRGYFGVSILWESSHPDIINSEGHFQKPIGNIVVTLTATLSIDDVSRPKVFEMTITGSDPLEFLQEALGKLEINHGIEVIFESIELPSSLLSHVNIVWESSHENIITHEGLLTLPSQTTDVTLTAHLSIHDFEVIKTFTYTLIGTEDTVSEHEMLNVSQRQIDITSPFFIDQHMDFTLGFFDGVMMKQDQLVLSGNQLMGSYTSPIYVTVPFTRVNVMWGSVTHPNARTQMHMRSVINGQWSAWTLMGNWGYGGENTPPNLTYFTQGSSSELQYRITLTRQSTEISSPRLHSVSINYVLSSPQLSYDITKLPTHVFYDVPQLRQADTEDSSLWNNICWGTSISMVLQHLGKLNHLSVPQAYYAPLIRQGTLQYGTSKNDIGATQFGLHVSVLEFSSIEMLLSMVSQHGPIIIGVSKGDSPTGKFGPLTFSSGHVIVVVGYTIHASGTIDIIVNDPAVSWIREPFIGHATDLMLVWDKGGVIISRPNSSATSIVK